MNPMRFFARRRAGSGLLVGVLALALVAAFWLAAGEVNHGPAAQTTPAAPTRLAEDMTGRFTFADLADRVLPSVVTVYVKRDMKNQMRQQMGPDQFEQFRRFFEDNPQLKQFFGPLNPDGPEGPGGGGNDEDNPYIAQTSGSGVIISADGYIITNWHVVGDAEDKADLRVMLNDETEVKGDDVKLVYSHQLTDLAILKINKTGLTPLAWGDSDALRIGERVAAIGSPLDLRATITQGIICAKHRSVDGMGLGDMLQTDAVINPGSSGGALVNLDGQLVGINRLITTNTGRWQGYGFAIPANDARKFADEVVKTGRIAYGYVGVTMASQLEDTERMREALGLTKDQKGVLIMNVTPGAPADKAGIMAGDFITEADGVPIQDNDDLLRFVARRSIGDKPQFKLLRADKNGKLEEKTVKIEIAERPAERALMEQMQGRRGVKPNAPEQKPDTPSLGLEVEPFNENGQRGLRVTDVAPDSPAAKAGLQPGDVLISINRVRLSAPADLERAIKARVTGRSHFVQLMREGRTTITTIDDSK